MGAVIVRDLGWRWTQYITILISIVIVSLNAALGEPLFCIRFGVPAHPLNSPAAKETFAPVILTEKAQRLRLKTGRWALHSRHEMQDLNFGAFLRKSLIRCVRMKIPGPTTEALNRALGRYTCCSPSLSLASSPHTMHSCQSCPTLSPPSLLTTPLQVWHPVWTAGMPSYPELRRKAIQTLTIGITGCPSYHLSGRSGLGPGQRVLTFPRRASGHSDQREVWLPQGSGDATDGVGEQAGINIWYSHFVFARHVEKAGGKVAPELRLKPIFFGSAIFPVGFFLLGFTSDPSISWQVHALP